MAELARIEPCLALIGADGFAPAFLEAVRGTGAGQVMVFSYRTQDAACLLSINFAQGGLGPRLAAEYLRSGFRDDPLRARILSLAPRSAEVVRLDAIIGAMDDAYRARFFEAPGLADKVAVLAAGDGLRLILNLYRSQPGRPWDDDLLRVLARMALIHFETRLGQRGRDATPEALMGLSGRERAVCMGILSGRKAEAIAHDLGIAPTSVATYRQRAYAKLGVTSRAGLFAICRG